MQDNELLNIPSSIPRRSILKSIVGIAATGALRSPLKGEPLLKAETQPASELANSIGEISRAPSGLATYELCEFKIPLQPEGLEKLNPYRATEMALDAEITLPSGKKMRVPGFFTQDYVVRDSRGIPTKGTKGWRVRFSGREAGAYNGKVELRVKGKLVASRELPPFTLAKSHNHGMIRISRSSPRYLEFDDGAGYFPIGQDVSWTTDVTATEPGVTISAPMLPWDKAFLRWFGRMGENGANWARVFTKPNFYMESGEPWAWELENAARLDKVLELARQNGIHICLCFNAERSDEGTCYKGSMDLMRNSNTAWGRLLSSQELGFEQFFTNALCQEMYRDKIRYVVGRWGYSSNIFSWELWNERETISSQEGVGQWFRDMTTYLRSVDPWNHLIKSSAHKPWSPEYWGKDNGDLNDVHPYFGWSGEEGPKNLGAFIPEFASGVYATGRPFLVGEAGIARAVSTRYGSGSELADKDVACFHLHEVLWGGLFSGAVGTGMLWYWDEHTDLHDAYFRFRAIANFVADIKFNHESFTRGETVAVSTDELRILELTGKQTHLIWLRHRDLSWYGLAVEKKVLQPVGPSSLTLTGLEPGSYRVEYWSPEEGKLLRSEELAAKGTVLEISLPEIHSELALKVSPLSHRVA